MMQPYVQLHRSPSWQGYTKELPLSGPFFEMYTFSDCAQQLEEEQDTPHRHEYIEVIWALKGTGQIMIDLETFELEADRIFCVAPRQLHRLTVSEEAEGYIIRFNDTFLHDGDAGYHADFRQLLHKSPGIVFEPELIREMKDTTAKLLVEYHSGHMYRTEMLNRYLKIFFIYMSRQLKQGGDEAVQLVNGKKLADRFLGLVEQHYRTHKTVAEYAALLFVTANYLSSTVKKSTGFSAGHHIRQRIILEARRQAASTDVNMKQIAWHLGFSDIGHFSKFFKTGYGKSFSAFKRDQVVLA